MSLEQRKARAIWLLRKVKIKPEIKLSQNRYIFELVDTSSSNEQSDPYFNCRSSQLTNTIYGGMLDPV